MPPPRVAIVVVDGVGVGSLWLGAVVKAVDVLHYAFGECHKAIGMAHEEWCKEFVKNTRFVWYHIVYQSNTTCFAIALDNALNHAIAGSEERHPIASDEHIGLHLADTATDFYPIEWVAGMDLLADS